MEMQNRSETQSIMRLQWELPQERTSLIERLRSLLTSRFSGQSHMLLRVRIGGFAGPNHLHRGHR